MFDIEILKCKIFLKCQLLISILYQFCLKLKLKSLRSYSLNILIMVVLFSLLFIFAVRAENQGK